jgi:hypothetical protein
MSRCAQSLSNSSAFERTAYQLDLGACLTCACYTDADMLRNRSSHAGGVCVTAFLAMCFSCRLQQLVQGYIRHASSG